jgi:hypothetical protein
MRGGITGCDRRTESDLLLDHQLPDLRCAAVAVLDRFDAGFDRAPHPFGGRGVGDDGRAAALGDFDDAAQLVERERGPRTAARTPAVVGVDLDDIDAVAIWSQVT